MRQVALLTRQWPQPVHERLHALVETRLLMPGAELDSDFFRTFNRDVTILCTSFLDDPPATLLAGLPNLALIAHAGTWRGPAPPASWQVQVCDSGTAGADDGADFALMQLFAARRGLPRELPETGTKRTLDQGLAGSLRGITVGLLGFDAVAAELAERCQALGIDVLCHVPDPATSTAGLQRAESPAALAACCDVISVHGPAATPLLTDDVLGQCRADAVVVNVTDHRLVDEGALRDALENYRIAAAALDVYSSADAWRGCPNLLLTPQLATNTPRARIAMTASLVEDIERWLQGSAVHNPVT